MNISGPAAVAKPEMLFYAPGDLTVTIQIKLQRSDNDFVLSVRNRTTPGMVITNNVIPLSTKGGMGHGMGLKNVVAILQKYHAEYILSSKDGWFQFTALAYL